MQEPNRTLLKFYADMWGGFSSLGRIMLEFLYPSSCYVCGKLPSSLNFSWPVCKVCLGKIREVPAGCFRCGRPHGSDNIKYLVPEFLCGDCLLEKHPAITEARSSIIYDGAAKKLICLFKYRGKTRLLKIFSPFMKETLTQWGRLADCDYIVPVPLHPRKLRDRTFNPSLLFADNIFAEFEIPVQEYLLTRTVPGTQQVKMGRKERMKAVKGVFAVREEKKVRGKRILLVDDVYTTGSTTRECAKMLKKAGAEAVYVFTLFRTLK